MKKRIVIISAVIVLCLLLVVGFARRTTTELSMPDVVGKNVFYNISSLLKEEERIMLKGGECYEFGEGRFVLITEDKIQTEQAEVYFGDEYGTLDYEAYLLYSSEDNIYVILETGSVVTVSYVLLYCIQGSQIELCEAWQDWNLSHANSMSDIELWSYPIGLGRTAWSTMEGVFKIDTELNSLVPADDELVTLSEECRWTVQKEELPVTIKGREINLPIGTEVFFVKTNMEDTYHIIFNELGEKAVLTYETDEYGRILIDGKSAACYFKYGILLEVNIKTEKQLEDAIAAAGEDEMYVDMDYVIQGETYMYHFERMVSVPRDRIVKWVISVYEGDECIQVIEQPRSLGVTPALGDRLWETDVNFDGRNDLILRAGQADLGEAIQYNCYLANEDGTFTECPAFFDISNPKIDKENHVIRDYQRRYDTHYYENVYEFEGNELKLIQTNYYVWNEEQGGYVLSTDS